MSFTAVMIIVAVLGVLVLRAEVRERKRTEREHKARAPSLLHLSSHIEKRRTSVQARVLQMPPQADDDTLPVPMPDIPGPIPEPTPAPYDSSEAVIASFNSYARAHSK